MQEEEEQEEEWKKRHFVHYVTSQSLSSSFQRIHVWKAWSKDPHPQVEMSVECVSSTLREHLPVHTIASDSVSISPRCVPPYRQCTPIGRKNSGSDPALLRSASYSTGWHISSFPSSLFVLFSNCCNEPMGCQQRGGTAAKGGSSSLLCNGRSSVSSQQTCYWLLRLSPHKLCSPLHCCIIYKTAADVWVVTPRMMTPLTENLQNTNPVKITSFHRWGELVMMVVTFPFTRSITPRSETK